MGPAVRADVSTLSERERDEVARSKMVMADFSSSPPEEEAQEPSPPSRLVRLMGVMDPVAEYPCVVCCWG